MSFAGKLFGSRSAKHEFETVFLSGSLFIQSIEGLRRLLSHHYSAPNSRRLLFLAKYTASEILCPLHLPQLCLHSFIHAGWLTYANPLLTFDKTDWYSISSTSFAWNSVAMPFRARLRASLEEAYTILGLNSYKISQ